MLHPNGKSANRPRRFAELFTSLLVGCACASDTESMNPYGTDGCDGGCSCSEASADVFLPVSEYAMWSEGAGPVVTTGEGTASSSDAETTTGEGTTGFTGTTALFATTTTESGATSTISEPAADLSDSSCVALCQRYSEADTWGLHCSLSDEAPEGQVHVVCTWTTGCDGRRHACLRSTGDVVTDDSLTDWLARVAHDEAGSVFAFDALHRELAYHGAPIALLRRVRRAAVDERRHAAAIAHLVRARRGRWRYPKLRPATQRDLLALTLENVVEGCVRETWSALSAAYQAAHAQDANIRCAMRRIAIDERRHAELAWAIDRWLRRRLAKSDQDLVERALLSAASNLRRGIALRQLPAEVVTSAGVPDGAVALRLVDGLAAALWLDQSSNMPGSRIETKQTRVCCEAQ